MKPDSANVSGGIGFCGLLAIVLITLKLMDIIDWSWPLVLAPLWVPVVVFVIILIISVLAIIIHSHYKNCKFKR